MAIKDEIKSRAVAFGVRAVGAAKGAAVRAMLESLGYTPGESARIAHDVPGTRAALAVNAGDVIDAEFEVYS